MQEHKSYDVTRMKVFQSDLTQDDLSTIIPSDTVDIVLLLFVLSSINPDKMANVLINISKVSLPLYDQMSSYKPFSGIYECCLSDLHIRFF